MITHLRVYKPDGDKLEFERGENTKEGAISEIFICDDGHQPPHPCVRYETQKGKKHYVEAHFVGAIYTYREEKKI